MKFLNRYIGNKKFYKLVILLIVPMIIQQGITNFVSLLDNVMVGSLGTEPMSGVAIVNQLIFIFNLTLFGGLSGISIFGAQFYGMNDNKGMRDTFRSKLIFCTVATIISIVLFLVYGEKMILLFLDNEANKNIDITITLSYAMGYMKVAIIGLFPFAIIQAYTSSLRETGETVTPMIASVLAIVINLVFNWLLIFGKLGFPELGVVGAAIATVMARFVEMAFIIISTHTNKKFRFVKGVYKSVKVPLELVKQMAITGTPLMINEILWSLGTTFVNQNYSLRGLDVVAATNITATVWQMFCIIMFSMGNAVSILVGQKLGAGDIEGAKDVDRKLIFMSTVTNTVIGLILIACAPVIPLIYNVEDSVRSLAMDFLMIAGASLPIHSFIHVTYFTIRSGGKTLITFLFDSVYTWCVPVVLSFILCKHTGLDIVLCYLIVQFSDIIKIFIGVPMLKSGFWAKKIIK